MQNHENNQLPLKNVICPHYNDVLNGRGKFAMHWNGNKFFRRVVESHKSEYLHADNDRKIAIATRIIQIIRTQNPPGRFLKLDARTKKWNDIGNKKATRKIRQALREGTTNSVPSSVDSSYNGSQHRSIASSANSVNTDDIDNATTMSAPNELEVSNFELRDYVNKIILLNVLNDSLMLNPHRMIWWLITIIQSNHLIRLVRT